MNDKRKIELSGESILLAHVEDFIIMGGLGRKSFQELRTCFKSVYQWICV